MDELQTSDDVRGFLSKIAALGSNHDSTSQPRCLTTLLTTDSLLIIFHGLCALPPRSSSLATPHMYIAIPTHLNQTLDPPTLLIPQTWSHPLLSAPPPPPLLQLILDPQQHIEPILERVVDEVLKPESYDETLVAQWVDKICDRCMKDLAQVREEACLLQRRR